MNFVRFLSLTGVIASLLTGTSSVAQPFVRTAPFDSVELEGGGHAIVKFGSEQQVRLLRGSTQFTRFVVEEGHKLHIEACNSECPRNYDLEVEISIPRIEALAISGGGKIEAGDGFASPRRIALAVDGGGAIDARALDAGHVTAAINGGGVIKLRAARELTAAINGGGNVRYWGNPRVTQVIEGGGSVERGE